MAIIVGSVAVEVVPSTDGFGDKLKAELGNLPEIKIQVDTTEALAKIDELRTRLADITNAKVRIDVDTADGQIQIAALKATLDSLQNKNVQVNVNDGGSSQATSNAIGGIGDSGNRSAAKIALMASGIITGIAAIIPIAGAAAAAVAGIGAGALALGAAGLVGKLALGGVGQALSAANNPSGGGGSSGGTPASAPASNANAQAQASLSAQQQQITSREATQSAAQQLTEALQSQRQAETSLTSAQQNAITAQQALTQARVEAQQALQDLSNQVIDNGLAQRQAALDLATAKQNLAIAQSSPDASNPLNGPALAALQLQYDQAKQNASELALQGQRLQSQRTTAQAQGVNGSPQVTSANAAIVSANQQVAAAQQQVAESAVKVQQAQQNVADTATKNAIAAKQQALSMQQAAIAGTAAAAGIGSFGQAMQQLDPVQQQFVNFLLSIKPLLDGLKNAAADSFLPLLEDAIKILLPLLPTVETILSNVGTAFGQLAIEAANALTGPFWTQFLQFLSNTLGPNLLLVGKILGNLFTAGAAAFEAFGPVVTSLGNTLAGLFGQLATAIQGGALNGIVTFIAQTLPLVGSTLSVVGGAIIDIIKALAPAAAPALAIIKLLAGEIGKLAPILGPVIASFVTLLDNALQPLAPVLIQLANNLAPALISVFSALAPIIAPLVTGAADLVIALLPLVPVLTQLISALIPPLITFLTGLINEGIAPLVLAIVNGLLPIMPQLAKSFTDILNALLPLLPQLVKALLPVIQQMVPLLPALLKSFTTLAVAFTNLLVALSPLLVPLTKLVTAVFTSSFVNNIEGAANAMTHVLNAATDVANKIGPIVQNIAKFFSNIWDDITKKINTFIGFFKGLPTQLSIAARGMFDGIKGAFEGAINGIIDGWNNLSFTIGGGQLPFPPHTKFPSLTLDTPNLPELHLAEGGMVTGMTAAVLGDNPSGYEVALPLDSPHTISALSLAMRAAILDLSGYGLGSAPKVGASMASGASTNTHAPVFNITEVSDAVGTANAIMRRQAALAG